MMLKQNFKNKLTRIEKYSKLRSKIDQEIKIIILKKENDLRLEKFKERIDKIDNVLFDKAKDHVNNDFNDFNSLIEVQKISNKEEINNFLNDIYKWKDVIESLKEKYSPSENLEDYWVPLSNEKKILIKLEERQKNFLQQKKLVTKIITNKNKIISQINDLDASKKNVFKKANLLKINHQIISQIKKYNQNFEDLINSKKKKTKWLFWVVLTLSISILIIFVVIVGLLVP